MKNFRLEMAIRKLERQRQKEKAEIENQKRQKVYKEKNEVGVK